MASPPKGKTSDAHGAQTTSTGHAADTGHGHGSAFPPFDPSTFAPQLVWLALSFGALYLIMSKLALPRIGSVLTERRERVQRDLAEAERLKVETDAALGAYEKSLSDARGKAQGLAKETRDRMTAEMDRERHRVDEANTKRLAETEAQIAATKARALANVDQMAAETASAIVEQLTGQKVSLDEVRQVAAAASRTA